MVLREGKREEEIVTLTTSQTQPYNLQPPQENELSAEPETAFVTLHLFGCPGAFACDVIWEWSVDLWPGSAELEHTEYAKTSNDNLVVWEVPALCV